MIKAVIFDLWHTLINPTYDYHTIKLMKEIYGFSNDFYNEKVKRGVMSVPLNTTEEITSYMTQEFGGKQINKEEFKELEKRIEKDKNLIELYDDTIKTLEYLKDNNVKIALISNAATFHKDPLYKFGLDKYFDYVCFSCDVGYYKPDKEIYQITLEHLGLKPEETIMVGDNQKKDFEMPRSLGINAFHLDRENNNEKPLTIKSLYEIKKYL